MHASGSVRFDDPSVAVGRPLKIAVVSKSDRAGGGAGRVAERLVSRLASRDEVVVHHWMAYPTGRAEHGRPLYGGLVGRMVQRSCRLLSDLVGLPDFLTPESFFLEWRAGEIEYDLVHFHDISRSFSPVGIRRLGRRIPLVWTFHDCSPFTGGCINPLGCTAFKARCGRCPQLGRWPLKTRIDRTGFMQEYKRRTARLGLFAPVAPSRWIAGEAVKAGFFDEPPTVIPNAVDTTRFTPLDRRTARRSLGLNDEAFTVLIAAGRLDSPFKGTTYAVEAINRLDREVQALFVGRPDDKSIAKCRAAWKHVAGTVEDESLLAKYFAAADVYLYPTMADNLPNTVLETMACGTPTIGFCTGGMPEMVGHEKTGYLVEPKDVAGLVDGLKKVMDDPDVLRRWAAAARTKAVTDFHEDRFVEDHLRLYREILGRVPRDEPGEILSRASEAA